MGSFSPIKDFNKRQIFLLLLFLREGRGELSTSFDLIIALPQGTFDPLKTSQSFGNQYKFLGEEIWGASDWHLSFSLPPLGSRWDLNPLSRH